MGGDFYWFKLLTDDSFLVGVIDCSGHGVPGAFISIVAYSILDKINEMSLLENPAGILQRMNREIKRILNQDKKTSNYLATDDGLDASICFFDLCNKEMVYAGTKQYLFFSQGNGHKKLNLLKGDNYSIGYRESPNDYEYTNHTLALNEKERFILCSDGIMDQIGGEKQIPLGKSKFINILERNLDKPLAQCRKNILKEFNNYRGNYKQLDDVTVIGFEIHYK